MADLTGRQQRGWVRGLYVIRNDPGAALGPLADTWLHQSHGAGVPFYANGITRRPARSCSWHS